MSKYYYDSIFTGNGRPPAYYQNKMNENNNANREVMQENRKNSVGAKSTVRMSNKKKSNTASLEKKRRATAVILGFTFAFGMIAAGGLNKLNDRSDAQKFIFDKYDSVVSNNVHFIHDGQLSSDGNERYYVDINDVGAAVAKSDDPELALFHVYDVLNDAVSGVFAAAKENNEDVFGDAKTFDTYVRNLGCVDKNGETDYEAYKDCMKKVALAKSMLDDASKGEASLTDEKTSGK